MKILTNILQYKQSTTSDSFVLSKPRTQRSWPYSVSSPDVDKKSSFNVSISSISPSSTINSLKIDTQRKHGKPSRISQLITDWVTDWWGLELICWVISALSVLAIVVVLEACKNKPVPQWPLDITINSLISILATIGQISMMNPIVECISQLKWLWFVRKEKLTDFQAFDDASRGPTGSLILLGKLRGLHLVFLGSVITILSIAFGAFAQQVVTYPLHLHPSGIATTPGILNITGASTTAFDSAIDNAISISLAGNSAIPLGIAPSCSTGNCTWSEYRSLGFCINVTDLSSLMTKNSCDTKILDGFFLESGIQNPGYPCFNYTLPFVSETDIRSSNLTNNFVTGNATLSNVVPLQIDPSRMQFLTVSKYPGTSNFSFASGFILYQPDAEQSLNSTLSSPLAFAFDFGICLQTYNTSVTDGVATTNMISSQPFNLEIIEEAPNSFQTTIAGDADPVVSVDGVDYGVAQNAAIGLTDVIMSYFDDSCYQLVNQTALEELDGSSAPFCVSAGLIGASFLNGINGSSPFDSAKMIGNNIATSLTNVFLTGAGDNAIIQPIPGTALSPTPFVGTNYLWLIYPTALISLTFLFLIATITKSHRLGSKVWKSSHLAALQGLSGDLHKKLRGLGTVSEMEERAEEVAVRFDVGGWEGCRLVEKEKVGGRDIRPPPPPK